MTDAGEDEEYIDSANTADYGIITEVWVDKRYDVSVNLLAAARNRLAEYDTPRETWEIGVVDLYHINPGVYPHEELEIGQTIRVVDPELTIDGETVSEEAVIQTIDVDLMTPANTSVTAGLLRRTIVDTVGDLVRQTRYDSRYDRRQVTTWEAIE